MNNWIIKGNPTHYDWDRDLRLGHVESWGTRFPQPTMATGDRVFLWESGGRSRIIGFATVVGIEGSKRGKWRFRVKYLSERFDSMLGIGELRSIPALRGATFLKPAIFRTVYPLNARQTAAIYGAVISSNPADDIWRDLSRLPQIPDADLIWSAKEGRRKLVTHLRAERAPGLAPAKKAEFRRKHGGELLCECCGRTFAEYGIHHEALFEIHHRKALGKAKKSVVTKLTDLAVLCSNCHRVIHRHDPMISVPHLAQQLGRSKRTE